MDVDISDLIDYFAQDYHTRAIVLHLEGIAVPRKIHFRREGSCPQQAGNRDPLRQEPGYRRLGQNPRRASRAD